MISRIIVNMLIIINLATHQSSRKSFRSSEHHLPLLDLTKAKGC